MNKSSGQNSKYSTFVTENYESLIESWYIFEDNMRPYINYTDEEWEDNRFDNMSIFFRTIFLTNTI
jgi:hypothetical protein